MADPNPTSPFDDRLATGRRYLDGGYAADNPGWHAEDAAHKAAAVHRLLGALGWTPGRVIDVGCGTGDVLRHLAALRPGIEVEGWDPAGPWSVAAPWLHVGDGRDARGDLVLALDVLEHVRDPLGLLTDLRAVAPAAILRVPLEASVLDLLRPARALDARRRWGHLHQWSLPHLRALVAEGGWAVRAVDLDRVPPIPTTPRARVMEGVRRIGAAVAPAATATALGGFSVILAATRADLAPPGSLR